MALDVRLAEAARPVVRLFTWDPPAVSFGFKQERPGWLTAPAWIASGCEWVERPTGGGVAFHGSDVSIAVVIPRTWGLALSAVMAAVCESAVKVCERFGVRAHPVLDAPASGRIAYCLLERSPYALTVEGRKLAGFALRRYPQSWLVQGSLLVRPLPTALVRGLPPETMTPLASRACTLEAAAGTPLDLRRVAEGWAVGWPQGWAAFPER